MSKPQVHVTNGELFNVIYHLQTYGQQMSLVFDDIGVIGNMSTHVLMSISCHFGYVSDGRVKGYPAGKLDTTKSETKSTCNTIEETVRFFKCLLHPKTAWHHYRQTHAQLGTDLHLFFNENREWVGPKYYRSQEGYIPWMDADAKSYLYSLMNFIETGHVCGLEMDSYVNPNNEECKQISAQILESMGLMKLDMTKPEEVAEAFSKVRESDLEKSHQFLAMVYLADTIDNMPVHI